MTTARGCPFCDYAGPSLVLGVYTNTYVIEPLNPVTPGHVLVIPKAHVADFSTDLEVTRRVSVRAAIWAQDHPGDYNFITSKGPAATQTIDHLHLHVVPRLPADGLMLPWSQPHSQFESRDQRDQDWDRAVALLESSDQRIKRLVAVAKAARHDGSPQSLNLIAALDALVPGDLDG